MFDVCAGKLGFLNSVPLMNSLPFFRCCGYPVVDSTEYYKRQLDDIEARISAMQARATDTSVKAAAIGGDDGDDEVGDAHDVDDILNDTSHGTFRTDDSSSLYSSSSSSGRKLPSFMLKKTRIGFVTFNSTAVAMQCAQTLHSFPGTLSIRQAPDPNDIIWNGLTVRYDRYTGH